MPPGPAAISAAPGVPQRIPLPIDVGQIACGGEHVLALAEGGILFSWGRGIEGQLGRPPPLAQWEATPRRVDEGLAALRARIRAGAPRSELEADAAALNALVDAQRAAAVGDAEAFGTRAMECKRVDLAAELAAAGWRAG